MEVGGTTRVFALLGDPVAHSLSPAMYNAAFRALGLDAVYVALRCRSEAVGPLMESLVRQGGGGNVTVPHKAAAAQALSQLGGPRIPICNTFWGNRVGVTGIETDSVGILAGLAELGVQPANWLLLGTGGSAHAALAAAQRVGASIAVRSRDSHRAREFLNEARQLGLEEATPESCQVVINCTPLGLDPADPLPLDPAMIREDAVALDLVYRRGETPWVQLLREKGHRVADGRTVLVEQGAAAFERWFEGLPAPREVMRAAIRTALG